MRNVVISSCYIDAIECLGEHFEALGMNVEYGKNETSDNVFHTLSVNNVTDAQKDEMIDSARAIEQAYSDLQVTSVVIPNFNFE
jgi:hypothetical protein